jgi:hypothetical protein
MEELIAHYLLSRRQCPLSKVGTLQLLDGNAAVLVAEKGISAPIPFIVFAKKEIDNANLIRFIASSKQITEDEASAELAGYCNKLDHLAPDTEAIIPGAGSFYVDQNGELSFRQVDINDAYLPFISAERMIRQHAVHQMTVGDRETTSAVMSEYYSDKPPVYRQRWWTAALILFVLASGLIIYYFTSPGHNNLFGNRHKPDIGTPGSTYRLNP